MPRDVAQLVGELTLEEKTRLLAGADLWSTVAVERLGIPSVRVTDGPNGARGPMLAEMVEGDPLTALCVPCGAALGATWDVDLIERVGAVLGEEARTKACRVLLAPTVNLHRSPLGGRNFESYSEDPVLAGRIATAFVTGAQSRGVVTTVKHFAGNESELDRFVADTVADERTLRELYLVPFEMAVRRGGALGIMTSYNRLNGEHCADSNTLLAGILRDEWGFEGFVISDWFALAQTPLAIRAGLDLEMPGPPRAYGPALAEAVRGGEVAESDVDAAVSRLLGTLDRVGALDDDPAEQPRSVDDPDHRAVARQAAIGATVLLRNEGVLPLDVGRLRRVAVIGPNAARAQIMGGGSANLPAHRRVSPLEVLRARLGEQVELVHEAGVDISLTTPEVPGRWLTGDDGEPGLTVSFFAPDDLGGEVLHRDRRDSGTAVWFGPPSGNVGATWSCRAAATLEVDEPGPWLFSLVQTGPSRLVLDGEVVLDGTGGPLPLGHDFLGLGSRELTTEIDLQPGRPVELVLECTNLEGVLLAGAKLGARPAPAADGIDRAVAAARQADAVVVVVGTDADWESEGADRTSMNLPGRQDELVERVLAVAPDAVVVLNTGSVVLTPWAERAGALLQVWFGGEEMADGLVDVLLGDAEPGGRLPTTVPVRLEHNPSHGNFPAENGRVVYGERMFVGYRWYEERRLPVAFPFGHGLSYTRFELGDPMCSATSVRVGEGVVVEVPVTNVGDRRGSEVVQLYVGCDVPLLARPPKELRAFARITLDPGETGTVRFELDDRAFAYWQPGDPDADRFAHLLATQVAWVRPPSGLGRPRGWAVDPGTHRLHVGRSSALIDHVVEVEIVDGGQIPG